RPAALILPPSELLQVVAREGAAPEERPAEPRALLVHPGGQPDRPAGREPLLTERPQGGEGGEHAVGPVVAPAEHHGVEVGADEHGWPIPGLPAADDVAGGVDARLEAQPAELADEP